VARDDPNQFWHRYRDSVTTFIPDITADELEVRCRLLWARDMATGSMRLATDAECGVTQEIIRLVTDYAYAPLPVEALNKLLDALRLMMRASVFLSRVEGAGARG